MQDGNLLSISESHIEMETVAGSELGSVNINELEVEVN